MSALDLLKLLERQELLSRRKLDGLRRQVEGNPRGISAASLAKALVKRGVLTSEQAERLLQQLNEVAPAEVEEEELGLAPDSDDDLPVARPASRPQPSPPRPVEPLAPELLETDDSEDLGSSERDPDVPIAERDEPVAKLDHDALADSPEDQEVGEPTAARRRHRGLSGWLGGLRRNATPQKYTANRWDSPLMLVGGGALMLLVMLAVGLYFYLSHGTGDDAFNLAYEDYRGGSYGQAIGKFERFLADYPDHPKADLARVRIGLARIWNDVTRKDWETALNTSRTELPKIEPLTEFQDARPELASLLPEIADGFAEQALRAPDIPAAQKYRRFCEEAFQEVNNSSYLPTSVRRGQQPRIEQILSKLESVERRINRDQELEKTIAEIQATIEQGQIAQAYGFRTALLQRYPGLELDDRLEAAVVAITQSEQEAIQPLVNPPTPNSEDRRPEAQFRVAVAQRRGPSVAEVDPELLFVTARGAAYGLRAASGELLWRRFIGFRSNQPPIRLSGEPDTAVLLVDERYQELVCVQGENGDFRWRLPCGGPPVPSVAEGDRIYVATGDEQQGRLLVVNSQTGVVEQAVSFPERLTAPPLVDTQGATLVQPGWQSSLYLLNSSDLRCEHVFYLGHAAGTVTVPPARVLGQILVAENPGTDFSLLHLLGPSPDPPKALRRVVDPVRLEGRVVVPMIPFGQRVLVVTDRGRVYVFEVDPNNVRQPIRVAASAVSTIEGQAISYPLLEQSRLWVGDSQLTHFELQISRGQLVRKWLNSKGDLFLGPLQLHGERLFHVRRRSGRLGATVAAMQVGSGGSTRDGELLWETDLGVPPAGPPTINRAAQKIEVVNGNAALFAIDRSIIQAGQVDQATSEVSDAVRPALQQAVAVKESRTAYFADPPGESCVLLDSQEDSSLLRLLTLRLDGDTPAAQPVSFGDGLLVPVRSGRVLLLDAQTGEAAAEPFQPALPAGTQVQWQSPTVTADGKNAVLIDAAGTLHRLTLKTDPQAHLASGLQVATSVIPVAAPTIRESLVYVAARDVGQDRMVAFQLEDFQPAQEWALNGRCVWGPYDVGDQVLVATDQNELWALQDEAEPRWKIPLPSGPLIGTPLGLGQDLVLASVGGAVCQLNGQTGESLARVEIDEPIGTGPVQFAGNRFLVCGDDGTVHVIQLPLR